MIASGACDATSPLHELLQLRLVDSRELALHRLVGDPLARSQRWLVPHRHRRIEALCTGLGLALGLALGGAERRTVLWVKAFRNLSHNCELTHTHTLRSRSCQVGDTREDTPSPALHVTLRHSRHVTDRTHGGRTPPFTRATRHRHSRHVTDTRPHFCGYHACLETFALLRCEVGGTPTVPHAATFQWLTHAVGGFCALAL